MPEFFLLLGINLFLGLSLLAYLFGKQFHKVVPYVYQISAFVGLVQLLFMKDSMTIFGDNARFWFSLVYLVVALANIVSLNAYSAFLKKMWSTAKILFACVTFPTILIATFFVAGYVELLDWLPPLPRVPLEVLSVILIICLAAMGTGVYASLKLQTMKSQPIEKGR